MMRELYHIFTAFTIASTGAAYVCAFAGTRDFALWGCIVALGYLVLAALALWSSGEDQ